MSLKLDAEHLATLIVTSRATHGAVLLQHVLRSHIGVDATAAIPACEMLPAYRVRLGRWEEEGVPPSEGLAEFVRALRDAGSDQVIVAGWHDEQVNFVLLFTAGFQKLLAIVELKTPYPMSLANGAVDD